MWRELLGTNGQTVHMADAESGGDNIQECRLNIDNALVSYIQLCGGFDKTAIGTVPREGRSRFARVVEQSDDLHRRSDATR